MTNAELAILSLVAEQPRHGYEIEQVIEERGMREWTEVGFSSICYLLKKLEKLGYVQGHLEEAERGPARKVYRVTQAGRDALHAGLLDALSVPRRRFSPLQLGLAGLPGLPLDEARAALKEYQDSLTVRLAHVSRRQAEQQPLPYFVDGMFEHSLALLRAELDWVEAFVMRLEGEHEQD